MKISLEELNDRIVGGTVKSIERIVDSDEGMIIHFDFGISVYVGFSSHEGMISYIYSKDEQGIEVECERS